MKLTNVLPFESGNRNIVTICQPNAIPTIPVNSDSRRMVAQFAIDGTSKANIQAATITAMVPATAAAATPTTRTVPASRIA